MALLNINVAPSKEVLALDPQVRDLYRENIAKAGDVINTAEGIRDFALSLFEEGQITRDRPLMELALNSAATAQSTANRNKAEQRRLSQDLTQFQWGSLLPQDEIDQPSAEPSILQYLPIRDRKKLPIR